MEKKFRKGMSLGTVTKRSKRVKVTTPDGKVIGIYPNMSHAAWAHGVKVQNVYKICYGYKSLLNGLVFQFDITDEIQ